MAHPDDTVLVGRPHVARRAAQAVLGLVVGVVGVLLVSGGSWFGVAMLLLGLYGVSELWRSATLTTDRLLVRSRVARRQVDLRDLTRVALSPTGAIWVAPAQGRPFYVRMVSALADGGHPDVTTFLAALRERATAAGAHLAVTVVYSG